MFKLLKDMYKKHRKIKKMKREVERWEKDGRPNPPPHLIKQREILHYARKYGLKTFVETGTFKGDMVEAMKDNFDKVVSIELSEQLFNRAREKFSNNSNVALICGDSGVELKNIIPQLKGPALFWLDGHYSGGSTAKGVLETPIKEELDSILRDKYKHAILIDDARCFGVEPDYPALDELAEYVRSYDPNAIIETEYDSIRVVKSVGDS